MTTVESRVEIDEVTFNRLNNESDLIDKYGKQTATNSCFPPNAYGYYGSRIIEEDDRYYLFWKRGKDKRNDG